MNRVLPQDDEPSLCFQHVPTVSVNVSSLRTGSLSEAISPGFTSACPRRSMLDRTRLETASFPGSNTALWRRTSLRGFALELGGMERKIRPVWNRVALEFP